MSLQNILSPFWAWKYLFKKPVTIRDPLNDRPGAPRYRGFHQNDVQKCIGCGTCETICPNRAIDMVPVEGVDGIKTKDGDSGLRPRIDYGRCCWCALCVDVCLTGSLTMSNAYTWVDTDGDAFRFIPGVEKKDWDDAQLGYRRPEDYTLTLRTRVPMGELESEKRIDNFSEIVAGYTVEQAKLEADRCVECGLCVSACPAHMSIPQYIKTIRDGDYEAGLKLLYETNPFSQVCGRVCAHECETACASRHEGDPIAIRWLKRHITDQVPYKRTTKILGKPKRKTGNTVAIVGSGPAGLTAAFDLARMGHKVTVFEALKKPGGMPRYGIPKFRMPYDVLDRDIGVIEAMGVEIRCNTRIGTKIKMDDLKKDYDAVVLAIGLHLGRSTRIPGSDHKDVGKAVNILRDIADGKKIKVPKTAVVIGSNNIAMSIARSIARLQKQKYGKVDMSVSALEDLDHFLADQNEVKECGEEGIKILESRGPQEIKINANGNGNGKIIGLRTWAVKSMFDAKGRFAPSYDENNEQIHKADQVIEAIGQTSDLSLLGEDLTEALKWSRGRVQVDDDGRTSENWLWSGGDCVKGPNVIHAVANGHRIADSIQSVLKKMGAKA